jgi:hypothetical protein
MKYILFVIDTESNSGNQQEMIQIDAFNEKLQSEDKFIFAAGIGSSKTATTIDNRAGKDQVIKDSLNSDEFYSGFWIIQAEPNEIEDLARQASLACNRQVEIRPFLA